MYAPHFVLLYNVIHETDLETFEDIEKVYVTELPGVFVDAVKAVNVRVSGQESADAVSLFIPVSVEAVDAATGEPKTYSGPQEFWAASDEERAKHWTLSVEGNGGETFFVKADRLYALFAPVGYDAVESSDGYLFAGLLIKDYLTVNVAKAMDESYNVTKVDMKDFGSERMRHWEVGGA